jgi:hypothetical protein
MYGTPRTNFNIGRDIPPPRQRDKHCAMAVSPETFVAEWGDALAKGQASLFVGSGVSLEAGYGSWSDLLETCARELRIKLHRLDDLAMVAQHYVNQGGNRGAELRQTVRDSLRPAPDDRLPRSLRILARSPLRTIWTTNYDQLIEQAWKQQGLHLDVKRNQADFNVAPPPWADGTLYKMHGCVGDLDNIVIAKDHYDQYAASREGFFTALAADLIGKRMLFLGFGHRDPNLAIMFSTLRRIFGNGAARHFSLARRPKAEPTEDQDDVDRRFDLWVQDWEVRYGVKFVEVTNWDEVPALLERVELRTVRGSVLISGSLPEDASDAERELPRTVAQEVAGLLPGEGFRLVSGFGLIIGSAAISGLLGALNKTGQPSLRLDRHMLLRPFPQPAPGEAPDPGVWKAWRQEIVSRAGATVIIAGAKREADGTLSVGDGVMEEFRMTLDTGRVPIPIGATGHAAARAWTAMQTELARWPWYPKDAFRTLNDASVQPPALAKAVQDILRASRKSA